MPQKKGSIPWNKGRKMTDYEKSKMDVSGLALGRGWNRGKKLSEEHKKNLTGKRPQCSKENNHMFGKKHSDEAKKKMSLAKRGKHYPKMGGENNHMWKGGITKIIEKLRKGFEFKNWRKLVFERDNYTCQKCFYRSGNGKSVFLNPHHINNFSSDIENRFNIDNGITLCRDCHYKFHTEYGFTNNNKKQIFEYLNGVQINNDLWTELPKELF